MQSKKLDALLDQVLLSPMEMETMSGRLEAARLIRKAYALGRRERGKRVAVGWVADTPIYDDKGRLVIENQWLPTARTKVEVIRVK